MPRERDKIRPTEKTAVERETDNITRETLRAITREKVIPKRMWKVAGQKIADLINDYHTAIGIANEIKVKSHEEFVERHKFQTLAIAFLKATDRKMTLALDVLDLNADYLDTWAGQYNKTLKVVQGWMNKDEKRYEQKFGPLNQDDKLHIAGSIPGDIREQVELTPVGVGGRVRSPNPSNANNERNSNPSGALNNNNANNTNGVGADREIVRDK
jgi:hypothetical protein